MCYIAPPGYEHEICRESNIKYNRACDTRLFYNTLKQIHPEVCHWFMRRSFILSHLHDLLSKSRAVQVLRATKWRHLHPICLANRAFGAVQVSNPLFDTEIASSLSLLAMTVLLAACLPLHATPATEPPLPSDTPPPTPTILWFPPSATPTPNAIPTYTATPQMSPGIGSVILTDTFTDKKAWDTVTSEEASVILKDKRLTLAVEPGVSVASLRRDMTFGNFYAELTARIGLCRANDTYGIMIRAIGNSFYRFNLSCSGLVTVERVKSGERIALLEPTASGDVPLGPPGEVEIGIWAVGGEMRLFLNGRYQFSVFEKTFPSGAFGVFVKSNADTPVTITFSDFSVYDVNYTPPTSTPVP